MAKALLRTLTAMLLLMLTTAPASAASTVSAHVTAKNVTTTVAPCTNWSSWLGTSTGWGQFRWCSAYDPDTDYTLYRIQVDDTLTDGYAVHVEVASAVTSCCPPSWEQWNYDDVIYDSGGGFCFQSTGAVATSGWPGTWTFYDYPHIDAALVKGRACGTGGHQKVAVWSVHLAP